MFEVTRGYIADASGTNTSTVNATWKSYIDLIAEVFGLRLSSGNGSWYLNNADGTIGFSSPITPANYTGSGAITSAAVGVLSLYNQAMGSDISSVSNNYYLGRAFRVFVADSGTITPIRGASWVCVKTDDLTVLHFFAGSGGPGGTGSRSLGYIAYYEYDNDGDTVPVIVISGTGYDAESAVGIATDPRNSLGNGDGFRVPYLAFTPTTFAEGVNYRLTSNVGTKVMGMIPMPFCYNELDFQPHPKLFCITDRPGTTEFEEGWITLNGERYYVLGLIAIKE